MTELSCKEQLDIFDSLVDEAYDLLVDFVIEREDEIRQGARERLEQNYDEYGDAAFHWTEARAVVEGLEECDDALNCIVFALYAREEKQ